MSRPVLTFACAVVLGAVLALVVRAGLHRPAPPAHTELPAPPMAPMAPAPAPEAPAPAPAPAPETPAAPAPAPAPAPTPPIEAPPMAAPTAAPAIFNTICPGCGGPVDPDLPTVLYEGKVIGFNCGSCRPRFLKDPQRFGPAALKNIEAP